MRNQLTSNTLTLIFSNGSSALLSLLLSILIGRVLGEEGLGIYAASLAWVFPLSLVAEFGLGTLITRDLAQNVHLQPNYLRAAALARLVIGGLIMFSLILLAPLLSPTLQVQQGIIISAPLVILNPFYGLFTAVFRARRVMRPVMLLNLGMLLLQVSLTTLVLASGGGVVLALIVNTVTSALQVVAAWMVYRRWFFLAPQTMNTVRLNDLLKRAFPFAVAAVLAAIQMRVALILLENLAGTGQVGYFVAAGRFIEGGRMIPHAFFDALLPTLSLLAAQPAHLRRTFRRASLVLVIFGLIFGLVCTFFALPLLKLTYGEAFILAAGVLQLLGWSLLPMTLKYARGLYWYALGRESRVNAVTLMTLIVQIALGVWLFPVYGAVGAAVVAIFIETISVLMLWFTPR